MHQILAELPKNKFDEDLKESYCAIFINCNPESPLLKLFWKTAVFWGMEFGGGGAK